MLRKVSLLKRIPDVFTTDTEIGKEKQTTNIIKKLPIMRKEVEVLPFEIDNKSNESKNTQGNR